MARAPRGERWGEPRPGGGFVASQGVLAANRVRSIVHAMGGDDLTLAETSETQRRLPSPRAGTETIVHVERSITTSPDARFPARNVCLRVLSTASRRTCRFAGQGRRRFRAVRWPEVGRHVLVASINGDTVVGSPSHVGVVAADVHLPSCVVTEPGASGCDAVSAHAASSWSEDRG